MLKNILLGIQKVMIKVVGSKELKKISIKDHYLFSYILKNGYEITNLPKIQALCIHWTALKHPKCEHRKENPQFYEKTKKYIEKRLAIFNQHLKKYISLFEIQIKKNPHSVKQSKRKTKNLIFRAEQSEAFESNNSHQQNNQDNEQLSLSESCVILQDFEDKCKNTKHEKMVQSSSHRQVFQSERSYEKIQDFKRTRESLESYLSYSYDFEQERNIIEHLPDEKNNLLFAPTLQDDYFPQEQHRCFFDLDYQ